MQTSSSIMIGIVKSIYQVRPCGFSSREVDKIVVDVVKSLHKFNGRANSLKGREWRKLDTTDREKYLIDICLHTPKLWTRLRNICNDLKKLPKYSNMADKLDDKIQELIAKARMMN
jgi:hypothetical protein